MATPIVIPYTPSAANAGLDAWAGITLGDPKVYTEPDPNFLRTDAKFLFEPIQSNLLALIAYRLRRIVKPTDQTVNDSTTLVADTALVVPVKSGKKYSLRYVLYVNCNSGTDPADFQFALSGVTATTVRYGSGVFVTGMGEPIALLDALPNSLIVIDAYIQPSADGNLTLEWAPHSTVPINLKVLAGSCVEYQLIP
ncbi:MAG TPA: hypothetical protein VGP72_32030 [Planctomycetota bacterium]